MKEILEKYGWTNENLLRELEAYQNLKISEALLEFAKRYQQPIQPYKWYPDLWRQPYVTWVGDVTA